MSKTGITWMELIKKHMEAKGPGTKLGDDTEAASAEWKDIKAGKHAKYEQKSSAGVPKARKTKKAKHPHKGEDSITRPGKKDFRTHKGDKYYNRKGHRQTRNRKGIKGKPFVGDKGYSAKDALDKCSLCVECAEKIQDMMKGGTTKPSSSQTTHYAPLHRFSAPRKVLSGGRSRKAHRRRGARKTSKK